MSYDGQTIQVSANDGIAELVFDAKGQPVNKFDQTTVQELKEAVEAVSGLPGIKGLIVRSAKSTFIVGADILEFGALFAKDEEVIAGYLDEANAIFSAVEDLPFPTVTAINGTALGGGFEMCLSTDFRVMTKTASVGLPEVKLGIFPGMGAP